MKRRSFLTALPGILLGLSGLAALVDETAWTRILESLLGHTAPTTATVVAGFMAGLALGAAAGGSWTPALRRPLRSYALLETGIAGWALALPFLVALADRSGKALLGPAWAAPGPADILRWITGFLVVALPAVAMGATFPVMVEAAARLGNELSLPRRVGRLYAANTAGAAVGTVLAGFVLIRRVGLRGTLATGAATSLMAAALALVASRREPAPGDTIGAGAAGMPLRPPALLLSLLAASGFTSLALEILWLRLFVFPLGSNILAFATVVAALVTTVAAGSWAGGNIARRLPGPMGLAAAQAGLALSAVAGLMGFVHLRQLLGVLGHVLPGTAPLATLGGRVAVVAILVGAPGLFMGAVLPLAAAWNDPPGGRETGAGLSGGWLYAALTAGNIAGALAAGYLLIPLVGIGRSILLAAAVSFAAASIAAWQARGSVGALTAIAGGTVLFLALLFPGDSAVWGVAAVRDPHARLLATLEGVQGTVTVSEVPPLPVMMDNRPFPTIGPVGLGYRLIAVDAVQVAGTAPDLRTTQRMQAHIPLLLHPNPHRVLQIGYGSGETTREAMLHHPDSLQVVELNRDIVRMARRWFPGLTGGGFTTVFTDARLAVRTSSLRWDVILNDSTYPGMAGSSQLYSLDHFLACRDHLNPGGVLSTWLPVDLPPRTFRVVLRTFSTAFPNCSFWLVPDCLNKHGVLVGSVDPGAPLTPRPGRSWPAAVAHSLRELGIDGDGTLAAVRLLDARGIARLAEGAPINSDDHPILEYPLRGVRITGNDFWAATLRRILVEARPGSHARAVELLYEGQAEFLSGKPDRALELYRRAHRLWPGSPWPGNLVQGIEVQRAQWEFARAMGALQAGRRRDAMGFLERCVRLAPEAAACRQELGRLLLWAGRPGDALPHLEAASRLASDPSKVDLALGDALRLTGDPARAERVYRRYLAGHPATFGVLAALAEAVAAQGRLREAEELALAALKLEPDQQQGRELLASIRAAMAVAQDTSP